MKDGKVKSASLLYGFFLGLLYFAVYPLVFLLCTDILVFFGIGETGNILGVLGPAVLISLIVSILLCIPLFIKKDSPVIMIAFSMQAVFCLVFFAIIIFNYKNDERNLLFHVLKFYSLIPALCGNLVAWGYYWLRRFVLDRGLKRDE